MQDETGERNINMKLNQLLPRIGVSALIVLLAAGCSKLVEFEGIQCIKTVDIAATNMECNWEKYNAEQKAKGSAANAALTSAADPTTGNGAE